MEHQDDDTARSILDGCEPILRGWEWSYVNSRLLDALKLQSRGECVTEGGRRLSVAFSPDGKRIISGYYDGKVPTWQTEPPPAGGALVGRGATPRRIAMGFSSRDHDGTKPRRVSGG